MSSRQQTQEEYLEKFLKLDMIDRIRSAAMVSAEMSALFILERFISSERQAYVRAETRGHVLREINRMFPREEEKE